MRRPEFSVQLLAVALLELQPEILEVDAGNKIHLRLADVADGLAFSVELRASREPRGVANRRLDRLCKLRLPQTHRLAGLLPPPRHHRAARFFGEVGGDGRVVLIPPLD